MRLQILASLIGIFTIASAFGDRQAIVGDITPNGFVVGTPADASDGLIKEVELRLMPSDPTEKDLDGKIIQMEVTVTSNQDVIIPLGSFFPGMTKIKYTKWGSNESWSGSFTVNHFYDTNYENFAVTGPWILSAEEFCFPGRVKLLAKRGWGGGWGVTYFLQVDNPLLIGPSNQVSVTIETHAKIGEWYYPGGETTALEVPKVSTIDQWSKEIALNSTVKVTGNLSLNGSPVATQASMPVFLEGISGKVDIGNGSAGLGAVAIGVGNPSAMGEGAVALGHAQATGPHSFAAGQAVANGIGAFAFGSPTTSATGSHSAAFASSTSAGTASFAAGQSYAAGSRSTALSAGYALGDHAVSMGIGTGAYCLNETVVGSYNKPMMGNATTWVATDSIFTVGNGTYYGVEASNALQILKNGRTTLSNKAWSNTAPLADPDEGDATDADGEALVVEGHTRLKGKVVIEEPQGNISMGIYQ